jgi:uroporphyrinogen-III synthase
VTPRLVLTRAEPDSRRFLGRIHDHLPVAAIFSPVFQIVPLQVRMEGVPDHVVFTSVQGVAAAARFDLSSARAWCVGPATTHAARLAGFDAADGGGDVERLTQTLRQARPAGTILHLHGKHVAGDLVGALTRAGLKAQGLACYDQQINPPRPALISAVQGTSPLVFPLFSPRSALILAGLDGPAPRHVVAMSQRVADAAIDFDVETVNVAEAPTEESMLFATLARLRALT